MRGADSLKFPTGDVSRLIFRGLDKEFADKAIAAGIGALLASGDFVEGEFKGLDGRRVKIGSVLMGLRDLDIQREAMAINLRPVAPAAADMEITLRDGSVLRATAVQAKDGKMTITDAMAGPIGAAVADVAGVRRIR